MEKNETEALAFGDRIEWSYRHHLNSRSSIQICKLGIFVKLNKKKLPVVHLDGNKNTTIIKDAEKLVLIYKAGEFSCRNEKNKEPKCFIQCSWCKNANRK